MRVGILVLTSLFCQYPAAVERVSGGEESGPGPRCLNGARSGLSYFSWITAVILARVL